VEQEDRNFREASEKKRQERDGKGSGDGGDIDSATSRSSDPSSSVDDVGTSRGAGQGGY